MLKGQQETRHRLCKPLLPHHHAPGQRPLQRTGEHTKVTCHRVLRPSCHEHSAHTWGWHTAKGVPGSPSALSCQHTDRGAQDNVHPQTKPPAHSPCTTQTAVSEAGTDTPPFLPCHGDGTASLSRLRPDPAHFTGSKLSYPTAQRCAIYQATKPKSLVST